GNIMNDRQREEELSNIIREATVDCYGLHEELLGLTTHLENNLTFPFKIKLLGLTLEAIDLTARYVLLKLVVLRKGTKYTIDLTDIEVSDKNSQNYLLIEAYNDWLSRIF
ncbi:MAG: hypothetical protein ACFFBD_27020, partial [Candidatus Hodarchaeota archaeon]